MAKKRMTYSERQALFHSNAAYRVEVFEGLLKHLRDGFSVDCYSPCSVRLIEESYVKYPLEFDKGAIEEAICDGKAGWEALGKAQANGTCMGNSRTWFYNMSHRYKWSDRQTIDSNVQGSVSVNVVNYTRAKPSQVDEDAQ